MISEENSTATLDLDALAQEEVIEIAQALIRFDTSNFGDEKTKSERGAAEYVAGLMNEVGLEPVIFESEPGRTSVVTRIEGNGSRKDALLIHGHLDVVPAIAADWSVDPFAAEIIADPLYGEVLWGRGAVDMKDMDAMMLAVMRRLQRSIAAAGGKRPDRDIVFAFFADEEAGGVLGASWAVDNRAELFDGVTEAISEVGGFSADIAGQRIYLLQTAEKGLAWLKLVARGSAGHGSRLEMGADNAVTKIAAATARIGAYEWPIRFTDSARSFIELLREYTGLEFDEQDPDELIAQLGTTARFVGAGLKNTTNPTGLKAGYKHNVIPGVAEAWIDARILPGQHDLVMDTIKELAGEDIEVSYVVRDVDLEVPFSGNFVEQMVDSLTAHDAEAKVVPYALSGGTDNKSLSRLGIKGYGFAPLRLPQELDFTSLFHGIDERVPLDSLRFGVRVLWDLLEKQ